MTQPHRPDATPPHAAHVAAWGTTLWLSLSLVLSPVAVRAANEPVDVPITRGKIDLGGLKPALGAPIAPSTPAPATPGAPHADAPAANANAAPTAPARPKPRTVADYAAEAKAKAAAEAKAVAAAAAAAAPMATKAPPAPPTAPRPTAKPRDDGLDKVAVKLVDAMARAAAKQGKREAAQPKTKPKHDPPTDHGGAHWAYEGPGGPDHWAQLKSEFNACAVGQRQSPIAIDDSTTLQGPAEPIGFDYHPSEGNVVHNGHTIQVDLAPGNAIAVRDSTYQLLQFHFHHPAEEKVNGQSFAMVAHLVHKNAEGQLAVVAVLMTPGAANPAIDTVWTYMPVDKGDRVKLPAGALNLPDLLPKDQRYYQFMGSLTTPPCTEGVLWMVLKTPVTLSPAQIRLFGQLFPHNARPVQPVNGRPVREAL